MTGRRLIIGSRGSDLALFQASIVQSALRDQCNCPADIRVIKTQGDKLEQLPFDKMEGKGFFTKELEEALLSGSIDLAVHSLKDLPTTQPPGLMLGAVGFRADRRELLLMRPGSRVDSGMLPLNNGAVVGTSSTRRKAQISFLDSSLQVHDLRGNVPTRIRKLHEGQYDAIIIAAAGVERLGIDLADLEVVRLELEDFLPAPGQGALALEIRQDDKQAASLVAALNDTWTETETNAERGLLKKFNAGCSLPLGAFAEAGGSTVRLVAVLGVNNGSDTFTLRRADVTAGPVDEVIDSAYAALTRDTE
jgi:hydroxymethylbilane synthase